MPNAQYVNTGDAISLDSIRKYLQTQPLWYTNRKRTNRAVRPHVPENCADDTCLKNNTGRTTISPVHRSAVWPYKHLQGESHLLIRLIKHCRVISICERLTDACRFPSSLWSRPRGRDGSPCTCLSTSPPRVRRLRIHTCTTSRRMYQSSLG
jgi:hypothetical protein